MKQLKNFLIKREQSQTRLSFAECEKSRLIAKLSLTLALLITAATGAWAQTDEIPVTWNAATKTGTFTMPDGNVELTPIYAPEFTATFVAGNANTIQSSKATVTVTESGATEGTDVTANIGTDGKLTPLYEGQTIILTAAAGYKFRSVTAKKAAATPSLSLTNPAVGQVIGSDGKNYSDGDVRTVAAVAMIAYVSGSTGLAIALEDESGEMDWNASMTVAAEHTPAFTGGTWRLPSFDDWNNMLNAYNGLSNLNQAIQNADGNTMEGKYWSSREDDAEAYYMDFSGSAPSWEMTGKGNPNLKARAVLAF